MHAQRKGTCIISFIRIFQECEASFLCIMLHFCQVFSQNAEIQNRSLKMNVFRYAISIHTRPSDIAVFDNFVKKHQPIGHSEVNLLTGT